MVSSVSVVRRMPNATCCSSSSSTALLAPKFTCGYPSRGPLKRGLRACRGGNLAAARDDQGGTLMYVGIGTLLAIVLIILLLILVF